MNHPRGWIYHKEQSPPRTQPKQELIAALDRLGQLCGAHPQRRKWTLKQVQEGKYDELNL